MDDDDREPAVWEGLAPSDDKVLNRLVERVISLGVGQRLPSERALAESLEVSRSAVRDRIQFLAALGILRRRVGSGTYIQAVDPARLSTLLTLAISLSQMQSKGLHSIREALERQAAREATQVGNLVLIAQVAMAARRMHDPDDSLDEADIQFHEALVAAASNPALSYFSQALAALFDQELRRRRQRLARLQNDRELMTQFHDPIIAALNSGDPDAAAAAVDAHFSAFREAI